VQLTGTPEEIRAWARERCPEIDEILTKARARVSWTKRQVDEHQAAALGALARAYNHNGARILEIGTATGYSSAVLALSAPRARVLTLNPNASEHAEAVANLDGLANVECRALHSWKLLEDYDGPPLDFVFVDGDHGRMVMDLPWFDHLAIGGLMLFHDYAPVGARRECPVVYGTLNLLARATDHAPDVGIVDDTATGMLGFIRRKGESWAWVMEG